MSIIFHTPLRLKPVFLILLFAFSATIAQKQSSQPVTGLKDNSPDWTVLINAKVITKPGQESENFQIVIQRDVIRDVRKSGASPAGARVIDLTGKTVYPGFIDAYSEVEVSDTLATQGAPHWNSTITPQLNIATLYENNTTANSTYRSQGFTTRLAVPKSGIIRGTSAVVICGAGGNDTVILRDQVFQHFLLTVSRGRGRDQYPNSPMGAVALARQTLLDTQWYEKAWSAFNRDDSAERPERNDALEKLTAIFGGKQSALFVTENEQFFLRANRFAEEFNLSAIMLGSGKEYQRLDAIKQTGRTIILPIAFPTAPNVGSLESARSVSLADLMHWDIAPENPSRVANAGIPLLLTSHGLTKKSDFLKNLRRSVQRGLTPVQALTALTTQPAMELGVSHLVGSITKGKLASLIITNGDIFESDIKIEEVWVAGQRFELQKKQTLDVTGNWEVVLPGETNPWTLKLSGNGPKLSGELRQTKPKEGADQQADTSTVIALSKVSIRDTRVSAVLPGKHFGYDGFVMFTLTFTGHDTLKGTGHWTTPDGKVAVISVTPKPMSDDTDIEADSKDKPKPAARATYAVNYPLGAFGRSSGPDQPKVLLIKNATIWTSGQQGILTEADMLVQSGRITAVGKDLRPPRGAMIIDATGKHLTAGIIDCHSHMATDGGVNESAQAITAEVRIGDFIDAHDMTIYRQLAGGVTMANILHGSANPIGGQNQVVKLRWGSVGEAMKFVAAPAGIKFALGENVKQSNWGDEYTSRYPQTRMGVQQIMQDAFFRAQQYKQNHAQWEKNPQGTPPRIDLELEALQEILDGQRWIHCHSYRQDEILTLMRTLEQFQIQIGTFQHILEGYKVAEEMAEHGAMGSSFSDWWAYKLEVYDAIPYNGALMHNAGVVVSFNSDDRELGRHLNHEAAKAVKYGGVPPEEALKFVTLNPARQLRIDQFVGSLENGKQADFVIWSGDPLSVFSRCEQTWIDGKKYFDREQDIAQRNTLLEQRTTLIQKVLASGEAMLSPGEKEKSDAELWPREDLFCAGHRHIGSQCNHGQQSRLQQLMRLINEEQRQQILEK
ncbi:MAG: amidohydrolase family protein [Planctomycetota bacterium]|nr:amidohydrolase family protein [Planctomycetota bacterium]